MVRYAMCKSTRYKAKEAENNVHVPLYSFPSNPELREKWVQALHSMNKQKNALSLPKNAAICVEHFEKHCLQKIGLSSIRLKPHSVPTIFPRSANKCVTQMCRDSNKLSSNNCHDHNVQEQSMQSDTPSTSNKAPQTVNDIQETPCIPIEQNIRYPGDISDDVLEKMSPTSLRNCISKLKRACRKKDKKIKQFQCRGNRQRKKIESLQQLLSDFNRKKFLSLNQKIRYTGDISDGVLKNMSPRSLRSCISVLKKVVKRRIKR